MGTKDTCVISKSSAIILTETRCQITANMISMVLSADRCSAHQANRSAVGGGYPFQNL